MERNEYSDLKAKLADKYGKPGMCEYMLKCTNDAVTTIPNPVLGEVPVCQRCADFYNK
jgi:hypothetical protein